MQQAQSIFSAEYVDTLDYDSGVHAPHPWGGLDETFDLNDQPWRIDPWQGLDADYRRWQEARYRQFADEFRRVA